MLGLEILAYLILKSSYISSEMNSLNAQADNHTNATIIRIWIALRERGCDSENFSIRITWFSVTVEKIWRFEVARTKLGFWKVLGSSLKNCRGLVKRICNLEEVEGFMSKIERLGLISK
jgi:hypothetical protein